METVYLALREDAFVKETDRSHYFKLFTRKQIQLFKKSNFKVSVLDSYLLLLVIF